MVEYVKTIRLSPLERLIVDIILLNPENFGKRGYFSHYLRPLLARHDIVCTAQKLRKIWCTARKKIVAGTKRDRSD